MKKKSSSQASWSLLSEGVSGARVEAHILRSALNQVLSALDDQPQVKEAVYTLCGDSFSNMELHLSKMERDLDRTSYALITMGDAFYRQQLTHEDRELVDQASTFVPKPKPTIVEDSMRRTANTQLFEMAKEELKESISDVSVEMDFDYKFQQTGSILKVVFKDTRSEFGYDTFTAEAQAETIFHLMTDSKGDSHIKGLKAQVKGGVLYFTGF